MTNEYTLDVFTFMLTAQRNASAIQQMIEIQCGFIWKGQVKFPSIISPLFFIHINNIIVSQSVVWMALAIDVFHTKKNTGENKLILKNILTLKIYSTFESKNFDTTTDVKMLLIE